MRECIAPALALAQPFTLWRRRPRSLSGILHGLDRLRRRRGGEERGALSGQPHTPRNMEGAERKRDNKRTFSMWGKSRLIK